MAEWQIGAILVGDEILDGRRQDKHWPKLIEVLAARGLRLSWIRVVGDGQNEVAEAIAATRQSRQLVFSCGGIGATPDDRTRQAAAQAFAQPLQHHPDGLAILERRYPGLAATPQRLNLVNFPAQARLIPNPVNEVPGFSVEHHHFVPGFPQMAWPMIEWVLDNHYTQLHGQNAEVSRHFRLPEASEGQLIPVMEALLAQYPVRISSLPDATPGSKALELTVLGAVAAVEPAAQQLAKALRDQGLQWE